MSSRPTAPSRRKFRRLGALAELPKNHALRAFPRGRKLTLSQQGSMTRRVGSFFVSLPSPQEEWWENNRMVSVTTPYVLDKSLSIADKVRGKVHEEEYGETDP